jgi:energy-converting hydrogenase Eha subunit G
MQVTLTNGFKTVDTKIGYSWTVFFFGFIALFIRQQWLLAVVQLLLSIVYPPLYIVSSFILAFFANERKIRMLVQDGYSPVNNIDNGIIISTYGFNPNELHKKIYF